MCRSKEEEQEECPKAIVFQVMLACNNFVFPSPPLFNTPDVNLRGDRLIAAYGTLERMAWLVGLVIVNPQGGFPFAIYTFKGHPLRFRKILKWWSFWCSLATVFMWKFLTRETTSLFFDRHCKLPTDISAPFQVNQLTDPNSWPQNRLSTFFFSFSNRVTISKV